MKASQLKYLRKIYLNKGEWPRTLLSELGSYVDEGYLEENKYILIDDINVYLTKKGYNVIKNKTKKNSNNQLIWIGEKSNPRFDAPKKAPKAKWYAILAYNGTHLLARVVSSYVRKSQANNAAKDLIGKLYRAKLVTTVVLEGPFKTMTQAQNIQVILPPPTIH